MAQSYAAPQQRRKKPATYGKASRSGSAWNTTRFNALDEEDATPQLNLVRASTVKDTFPIDKPYAKTTSPDRTHTLVSKQDVWDVSTDEERTVAPQQRRAPSKLSSKQKVVKNAQSTEEKLAPWEQSQTIAKAVVVIPRLAKRPKVDTASVDRQLQAELAASMAAEIARGHEKQGNDQTKISPPSNGPEGTLSGSALERLRAKRIHTEHSDVSSLASDTAHPSQSRKRHSPSHDNVVPIDGKRARMEKITHASDEDVVMQEAGKVVGKGPVSTKRHRSPAKRDEFALSSSDSDQDSKATKRSLQNLARQKLKPTAKIGAASKSTKSTTDKHHTATANKSSSTPPISGLSTPPQQSPDHGTPPAGTMTPRQTQIWSQLLPDRIGLPTPGQLPMQDLRLSSNVKSAPSNQASSTANPQQPARQVRLIDRMRATAPQSDDESDDTSIATDDLDTATPEQSQAIHEPKPIRNQTQSQPTIPTTTGPKITYAKSRSYLKDDLLDDSDLIFSFPTTPHKSTTTSTKPPTNSNPYDLDSDSDTANPGSRLRSIHELRAGGGAQRFMDETSALLDDIRDHNMSGRARRRSALVEVAEKLRGKAFAEKFVRHGFEARLMEECAHSSDEVTNLALSVALVGLLAGGEAVVAGHVVVGLKEKGIVEWFVRGLGRRDGVRRLVKERRWNMAQAAQAAFVEFVESFRKSEVVWDTGAPDTITPRLVSLKGLDLIVRRLRAQGDRSDLLDENAIKAILVAGDSEQEIIWSVETALQVSLLESLSTSGTMVQWHELQMDRLQILLVSLQKLVQESHVGNRSQSEYDRIRTTHFLLLRLLLNITNEPRHCLLILTQSTTDALLHAVQQGFVRLDIAASAVDMTMATVDVNMDPASSMIEAADDSNDEEDIESQRKSDLDTLILSLGITINLAKYDHRMSDYAVKSTVVDKDAGQSFRPLRLLVDIFKQNRGRALDADTEFAVTLNVAHGYLAVLLGTLCQYDGTAIALVARNLGANAETATLTPLVTALEEFVAHHEKVDRLLNGAMIEDESEMAMASGECEKWSAFTEIVKEVLRKVKAADEARAWSDDAVLDVTSMVEHEP